MLICPKADQSTFTGKILSHNQFPSLFRSHTIPMPAQKSRYSLRSTLNLGVAGSSTPRKVHSVLQQPIHKVCFEFHRHLLSRMLLLLHDYPAHYRFTSKAVFGWLITTLCTSSSRRLQSTLQSISLIHTFSVYEIIWETVLKALLKSRCTSSPALLSFTKLVILLHHGMIRAISAS